MCPAMPASTPLELQTLILKRNQEGVLSKEPPAAVRKATQIDQLTAGYLGRFTYAAEIKRRARKIKNPVERLKYLQRATTPQEHKSFKIGRSAALRSWSAAWVLAVLMCFLGTNKGLSRQSVADASHRQATPAVVRYAAPVSYPAAVTTDTAATVWPVEQTSQYDLYSNGLRIENRLAISGQPRSYSLVGLKSGTPGPRRTEPAGIVFHMTESRQAPFEPDENSALRRISQGLLEYVRKKQAYHFVIDRFGQVYRIVRESDTANHAGNSVWADSAWLYLNLNASFIGVAFEASTENKQKRISDPQLHAARLLTDMLRATYHLPAANCVTHAQVSVNPRNMRIGWHSDWGTEFPFAALGLPDNYEIPNPAFYLFGFEYDQAYVNATGAGIWKGLALAKQRTLENAAARGMTLAEYRHVLQKRYNNVRSALEDRSTAEDETGKSD
jgi:hypothetical protein